ncbi:hypothetical protein JCM8097_008175 [Rhodosporidiobolus ruineniae]
MELPNPPTAAYLANAAAPEPFALSSPPLSSPSSPFPSRPASPTHRTAYAYPTTPSVGQSTAPPSRSESRSKEPLFKRERRRAKEGSSWFSRLFGQQGPAQEAVELEERRGRRLSSSQIEAAFERNRAADAVSQRSGRTAVTTAVSVKEKGPWWRLTRERAQLVVGFAMIILVGMNDSATGANLDSMQEHYKVSYDEISLVFLANVAGYFISSMSSTFILHHFGLQIALGVACLGMCIGTVILCIAPPFPVFVISLAFMGFGSGMYDTCITTVISHEEDGILMSLLYSCFGVGATFSPLIIGSFVDRNIPWQRYYAVPLGLSLMLAVAGFFAFRGFEIPPDEVPEATPAGQEGEVVHARAVMSAQERMKRALKIRAVWVGFALIMLAFATTDILSSWLVSFMVEKRASPQAASRYMLAGVWAGIAFGRVSLAFLLGKRMGEKSFAILMLILASGVTGILYVRSWAVDAVAAVLVGIFLGPVTPKVLSVVGARSPPSLKGSVMSLTIGLGLIGSAVAPLLFGIVAGRGGLSTLPAVLIGCSVVSVAGWAIMPRNRRRED